MKIRIKGDSVRFRLTMTEVDELMQQKIVEESTTFNENEFVYALRRTDDINELTASFKNNRIELVLPASESDNWQNSSRVGFENNMTLDNGKTLHLLVEKDFVCLDETTEDQSDNYPNPKADLING